VRHLFVTQDYPPDRGGMARRHVELCRRLAPEGVVVSTVAAPGAEAFDRGEPYPVARQRFGMAGARLLANEVRWGLAIAAWCRRGAEVVHLGNLRPCGYAVIVASRLVRRPYFVYVNGGDLLRELRFVAAPGLRRSSGRDLLGRAAGVVANSAWTADLAREVMAKTGVVRPPPVAAIELGTDPARFSPARDTGALRARLGVGDAPLLLTVARLVPHKGQDVAIRALAALAPRHPDARYLLVGDGHHEQALRDLARTLGVADRVIFAGALPDAEVAEACAAADIYLGLSRLDRGVNVEGFGISFVEAAASGTPSVAGDSGGVRAAVRDGETGLVVPPEDVGAVAAAIERLLGDPELRRRMGEAGRRAAETHYTWDRVARETLEFVRGTLGR
jgi:phosphatidylinositol alpha-1,6-mannosyltransferase